MFLTFSLLPSQEAAEYSKDNGLFHIETSAKTALNVEELFKAIGTRNILVTVFDFHSFSTLSSIQFVVADSCSLLLQLKSFQRIPSVWSRINLVLTLMTHRMMGAPAVVAVANHKRR